MWLYFSLYQSIDEFNKVDNSEKRAHSKSLFTLRCIAHVLPLSPKHEKILQLVSYKGVYKRWKLDGWNDHVIQSAQNAVLNYHKVCIHNISLISHTY